MHEQVDFESACLLHHRVVGEQDAIVTFFTRRYGRLSLWVTGVLSNPGAIPLFKPLLISWRSKNDNARLQKVELDPAYPDVIKSSFCSEFLFTAFYINELCMKFLPTHADNPALYNDYLWMLDSLAKRVFIEPVLRIFERQLLITTGHLSDLSVDALSGQTIQPELHYCLLKHPHYGLGISEFHSFQVGEHPTAQRYGDVLILGKHLIAFNNNDVSDPTTLSDVKRLMRHIILYLMDGKPFKSRSLFKSYKLKQ
ncbi:DNA repair protein RecO [Litoribrevibacter euphylliae]|uniref:DNA repair protein RecO n=1 Tax=Litoribrevibacter euphylliae TaxID=1834034 RepID=A0ABV7HCS4_9GAMM